MTTHAQRAGVDLQDGCTAFTLGAANHCGNSFKIVDVEGGNRIAAGLRCRQEFGNRYDHAFLLAIRKVSTVLAKVSLSPTFPGKTT